MKTPHRLAVLIHAYLSGTCSEEEVDDLNSRLRADEGARDLYLRLAQIHSRLSTDADLHEAVSSVDKPGAMPIASAAGRVVSLVARSWLGAAASVVVGISSASVAWAIAVSKDSPPIPLPLRRLEEIKGPIPPLFPLAPGAWSGDDAEVVELNDFQLGNGRALRFLRAQPDFSQPKSYADTCDVYQLVDLGAARAQVPPDCDAVLTLSVSFLDLRTEPGERMRFGCRMAVFGGDPSRLREGWPVIQDSQALSTGSDYRWIEGGQGNEWIPLRATTVLPPTGEFAVIQLLVYRDPAQGPGEEPAQAMFGKHYARDVNLSLQFHGIPRTQ